MRVCRRFAVLTLGALLTVPTGALAQTESDQSKKDASAESQKQSGSEDAKKQDRRRNGFRWRNRPTFQFGEVRLDIRFKTQLDWRVFDPDIDESLFDLRQVRGGLNAEIGNHFEMQAEHDLYGGADFCEEARDKCIGGGSWRDLFVRWRTFRQAEVTAGRFKVPFGREELISFSDVDFAYRSLVSTTIPPARDKGVMVNGRFLRRGLTYEVGVFDDDGDNGRLTEPQFAVGGAPEDIGPSFAARVTATPLRPLGEHLETFRVGFAYGLADIPEGLNSLRGQTVYGTNDFFEPVYVNGQRQRMGLEATYTPGPFGLAAEWMQAREERKGQGLGDVDLSDFITTGWYASATWLVTGEDKEDFNNPRNPIFEGGIGAVEVAARYEKLLFESEDKTGPAFRNPRAQHILPNSDRVWTVGVNWFLDRWVRLTINGIREEFEDVRRLPVAGITDYWSGVARLQIVF
jgi:phosphate-selective porin OprO and OprP